ncbi:hypothetical protein CWI38_0040p0090 [Hamiltosporidium tvaerminnensis]|uniref:Uncharacterized protein n=1 Tax=Hamiltosporidium tvaerminnensis TaxID=1176355 RepID=A0A4Q9M1P9_9MICR|nr:hypothetical protein LUQ84_001372 [Hamiltosporidium tvaerminnensis]TBU03118.1 hypothetical protein CWI37_0353p0020 [Hamiltosporidium tvaerminnensis]TBU20650.1 hypothetical protein CWI38_0040p0090 [Hamiltosporidium tvaerminnensis]
MKIIYRNIFLIYIILILNKSLLSSILCKKVVLYSIETYNNDIKYNETNENSWYEFKLENCNLLKMFSSVYLLENGYLKCCLRSGELKYFVPKKLEISESRNIILDFAYIGDDQENSLAHKFFLGQVSVIFLQRFARYITISDICVTTIYLREFINILRVLEILGLKRTKNNNLFLTYVLINSFMKDTFNFKCLKLFLNFKEFDFKLSDSISEYLFGIFSKLLLLENNPNHVFLLCKSNESMQVQKIILSYSVYNYRKEKLCKQNFFIVSNDTVMWLEKILKLAGSIDCVCFFIQTCKIDSLHFNLFYNKLSINILNLLWQLKLEKLKNLTLVDRFDEKIILKLFMNYGYFNISECITIISNLNSKEIDLILTHCKSIKKLAIVSDEAHYDIILELHRFASNNPNIFIKYKCKNFVMNCNQNDFFADTPENFSFIVGKYNVTLRNCDSCYKTSLIFFRRIMICLEKNKSLNGCKFIYYKASNVKDIWICTKQNNLQLKIHSKLIEYLADLPALEAIFFENILFTKKVIRFVLQSKKIMSLKLRNVQISSEVFSKYKIYNYVLQGLTIKKSDFIFNIDFLRFLSMFKNLSFLKVYIQYIDTYLRKKIYQFVSKKANNKFILIVSALDYLKVTTCKSIIGEFPILFSLSKIFDLKKLRVLIIEIVDFSAEDLEVILKLTNLTDIQINIYRKTMDIDFDKLIICIKNNKIEKFWFTVVELNKNIIKFLYLLKDIKLGITIAFNKIQIEDFTSPITIAFVNQSVVSFNVNNSFVIKEKLNYFKEKGISISTRD